MPGAGACEHSWVLEALGTKEPSLWRTLGEAEEGSSDSSPSGKVCNMDADLLANQKNIPNFLGSGAWWYNMFEERLPDVWSIGWFFVSLGVWAHGFCCFSGDLENTRGPKWQPGTPDVPQLQLKSLGSQQAGPNNTHWKHTYEDTFNLIKVSWGEEADLKMAILMLINLFLV